MRLAPAHGEPGVEMFVYGVSGGAFPARQHRRSIEGDRAAAPARSRRGRSSSQQSEEAIAAGAFHNDVVAVANERVLFAHEQAFADKQPLLDATASAGARASNMSRCRPPRCRSPTRSAPICSTRSWSRCPTGELTLIVPDRGAGDAAVWGWLERHVAGNGPIRRVEVVDVRQSMANGGGPACLRLRVVADPATVDPRFLVDEAKLDRDRRRSSTDTGRSRSTTTSFSSRR